MLTIQILLSFSLSKCGNWEGEWCAEVHLGRKVLAVSLQPTSWTLAFYWSLRTVDSRVFPYGMKASSVIVSASRGAKVILSPRSPAHTPKCEHEPVLSLSSGLPHLLVCSPVGLLREQGLQRAEGVSSMWWGSAAQNTIAAITLCCRVGLCLELQGGHWQMYK